jgi:hypothetical protein
MGGDKFMVLLPEVDGETGVAVAKPLLFVLVRSPSTADNWSSARASVSPCRGLVLCRARRGSRLALARASRGQAA